MNHAILSISFNAPCLYSPITENFLTFTSILQKNFAFACRVAVAFHSLSPITKKNGFLPHDFLIFLYFFRTAKSRPYGAALVAIIIQRVFPCGGCRTAFTPITEKFSIFAGMLQKRFLCHSCFCLLSVRSGSFLRLSTYPCVASLIR